MTFKFNPCFCIPLKSGVLAISIFKMLVSVALAIFGLCVLVLGTKVLVTVGLDLDTLKDPDAKDESIDKKIDPTTWKYALGITFIVAGIISFLIDFLLYQGATRRNSLYCTIWMVIAALGFISTVYQVIRELRLSGGLAEIIGGSVGLVLQLYALLVVLAFRMDIVEENQRQRRIKHREILQVQRVEVETLEPAV